MNCARSMGQKSSIALNLNDILHLNNKNISPILSPFKESIVEILDLKKEYKYLYQPSAKKAELVKVPKLQFAMIDGAIERGKEPGNSPSFAKASEALYSLSYPMVEERLAPIALPHKEPAPCAGYCSR